MTKAYNDPEFQVVLMADEDVLTASKLDQFDSAWETNPSQPGSGTAPIISL